MISNRGFGCGVEGISSILELDPCPPPTMSTSFLEPILKNRFNEKRGLPLFFSSLTSDCPLVRLSCDREMLLLEVGSWTIAAVCAAATVGSGSSDTAFLNFGLHEEALSRFSFSLTTGESDLKLAPGFLANRLEVEGGRNNSSTKSAGGGFGAILLLLLLLLLDRISSTTAEDWPSVTSSSISPPSCLGSPQHSVA